MDLCAGCEKIERPGRSSTFQEIFKVGEVLVCNFGVVFKEGIVL